MSTETTIDLGGGELRASNMPVRDANGLLWKLTAVENWYASATETALTERERGAGAFTPAPSRKQSKALVVRGWITGADAATCQALGWDTVLGISSDGMDIPLVYTDATGSRMMMVRLSGTSSVDPLADNRASFMVSLVAYNPRKYDTTEQRQVATVQGDPAATGGLRFPLFGGVSAAAPNGGLLDFGTPPRLGVATVSNSGTADTYPTFTVTGGFPQGFEIGDSTTGQVLRYNRPVLDGETVVIDTRTMRALSNGVNDYTDSLVALADMRLGKRQSKTFQVRALGTFSSTASMTVSIRNAWW